MTAVVRPGAAGDEPLAQAFLRDALESARTRAASGAWAIITLPAPCGEPLALWDAATADEAWLWQEPQAAWSESAVGDMMTGEPPPASDLRAAIQDGWSRASRFVHPSIDAAPVPRAFGGMCFDADAPVEPVWQSFGHARFLVPRWRFVRIADSATLTLCVRTRELDHAGVDLALREHRRLSRRLAAYARPPADRAHVSAVEHLSLDDWTGLVIGAREEVRSGRFTKLVAARRSRIALHRPIDAEPVLAALLRDQRDVTVFGLRLAGATFLGASPETLVARSGQHVRTEALAGTAPGTDDDVERLLASAKDRHEQAIVVDEIAERLRSVCARVDVPRQPHAHRLRHVTHLRTPIEAELAAPLHVLDLVRLLHPTPAVAGLPRDAAMRWIATHERSPRGWYAGPVGWFDQHGDGRFIVGIRSALLAGKEAFVFAGAGIVAASEPSAEYDETGWKLRAMISALLADEDRRLAW